jgi:YD repeat-containing protein
MPRIMPSRSVLRFTSQLHWGVAGVLSGFKVDYQYDERGNLIFYDYMGDEEFYNLTIRYEYDDNNNMIKKIKSTDEWITYEYDNGNNIRTIDSDGQIQEWEYDDHGNVLVHINNLGNTVKHEVVYYDNGQLKLYDGLYIPLI